MYPPDEIEFLPGVAEAEVEERQLKASDASDADSFKRETLAGYYAHVSALDDCFGRLLKALDDAGIAENTIVVFTSDHGDMLFSQNKGWKSKPWRESVGVPLLIRWPKNVPDGRETGGPIGLVDLMPTLLAMMGVTIPDGVEGKDLSPFVMGDEGAAPESQLIGYWALPDRCSPSEWRGVVTKSHTYARLRDEPWILYDDETDPFQQENLVRKTEHEETRQQLEDRLQEWLERIDDPFEEARTVADKYCKGHVDNILPFTHNPEILKEQQRRREERTAQEE